MLNKRLERESEEEGLLGDAANLAPLDLSMQDDT